MHKPKVLLLVILLLSLLVVAASGQKKKPGVLGTTQLPGDNGKINQAYTMGFDLPMKCNFTLREAHYSIEHMVMGDRCFFPSRAEKLLVLTFTYHNPNKKDLLIRADTFRMTAIDSKDVNHIWSGSITKSGDPKNLYGGYLKPAQKVELTSCVVVPADGSVPKLMIQYLTSPKVLRYDLHSIVKPLEAPYADPNDATGATALEVVPAEIGKFYPFARFDVKLNGTSPMAVFGNYKPEKNKTLLAINVTVRNPTNTPLLWRYDTMPVAIYTADGDKATKVLSLAKESSDDTMGRTLDPGESVTGRMIALIPANTQVTKIQMSMERGHVFEYNMSGNQ